MLITGLPPPGQEGFDMIGVFEIFPAVVAAGMPGDELIFMVDAQAVRIDLHGQPLTGHIARERCSGWHPG